MTPNINCLLVSVHSGYETGQFGPIPVSIDTLAFVQLQLLVNVQADEPCNKYSAVSSNVHTFLTVMPIKRIEDQYPV